MSAIASFFLIGSNKLTDLRSNAEIIVKKSLFSKKVTDNYWQYLADNAKELPALNGSGYIYGNLFVYLQEEKNIDLLTNQYSDVVTDLVEQRGATHFIFTSQQAHTFLPQLDHTLFPLPEIRKFNEEFSEEGDEETAVLMLDAIKLLEQNLRMIGDETQVLLLIIG